MVGKSHIVGGGLGGIAEEVEGYLAGLMFVAPLDLDVSSLRYLHNHLLSFTTSILKPLFLHVLLCLLI